jgi:photosystem II stability/assembly factor-like uncharacterized protein
MIYLLDIDAMKYLPNTFKLFVNISILLAVCASCTYRYNWVSLGPFETSGAIRHILVDTANANRLYAAAENGGIWVLDDVTKVGTGWRPISDQLENLQMRGIAKSSLDPNYIVTANALGYVYHTKNSGQTWERVTNQNFQYVRRILIEEKETKILVGRKPVKVKVSLLWIASRTGLYRLRLINHEFKNIVQLWPASNPGRQIDVLDVAKQPSNPDVLFIGVRNSGVWQSLEGGASWSLSADWTIFGDSPNSEMIKLAINDSRVVAKLGRNVIRKDLADMASNWISTNPVNFVDGNGNPEYGGSDIGYRGNYSGKSGEWAHAIAIHPTNPETLVAGQADLFLSADGGSTWVRLPKGHEDIQSLAFSPRGDQLYIANDGGVFQVSLGDNKIIDLNKKLTTMQFYRVGINGPVAVGNADHQGIRGTSNLNADPPVWTRATSSSSKFGVNGLENDFVFADPKKPKRFFVGFGERFLLRLQFPLTAGSQDLLPFHSPATPLQPFTRITNNNSVNNQLNYPVGTVAFDPRKGANIILTAAHEVINESFSIRITRNGNANPTGGPATRCGNTFCFNPPVTGAPNWNLSYGPVTTPIVSIAFSPTEPKKVYALDEAGSVIVKDDIDDDLTGWRAVGSLPTQPDDHARQLIADIATPGKLYAISHQQFLMSNDGGNTWPQRSQGTLPADKFNCIALHPTKPNLLYLGTDTGVLASSDGGSTWKAIDGLLPNAPVMQVFTDNTYLYAVTFGRGLWRAKLPK